MADRFKACSVEGCNGNTDKSKGGRRGFCRSHYGFLKRNGDPLARKRAMSPHGEPMRFLKEVVAPYSGDDCLSWPYATLRGYGQIRIDGRLEYTHRVVCAMVNGEPASPDLIAAHSCGNGRYGCVNPKHLRWATSKENGEDAVAHGSTPRGEKNRFAKLTEGEVLEIRSLRGKATHNEIAAHYGICASNVSIIQTGKSWTYL
jgi:hypothetical protein